jgi:hypothetical protein
MNDGKPYCLTCNKFIPQSEIEAHPHKNRFRLEFAHVWTPSEVIDVNKTLKAKGSGMYIELSGQKTEFDVKGKSNKSGEMELLFRVIDEVLSAKR